MTEEKLAEEYAEKMHLKRLYGHKPVVMKELKQAFLAGLEAKTQWHELDWKKDYPKLDRLVRVRTNSGKEYICQTYAYQPTEDEIGYGSILTQFEQLDGDWVDDNEIEYWCYIEPFNFKE